LRTQLEASETSLVSTNKFNDWSSEQVTVYANKDQEVERSKFIDRSTGTEMKQICEPQSLLEWFADNYKEFGAALEFVSDKSQEGAQFVKGFGGVGGLLRYKADLVSFETVDNEDEFFDDDEED
jgi:peptide chain release factor subunit 1